MMKTSCVAHPPKEPLIIIRQWQVEFCEGDKCAAALMSFLEYWHNIKLAQSDKSKQSNDTAQTHGDDRVQDESLVQFHTSTQLSDGIMGLYSETKIRKGLRFLEQKGVIDIFPNPNPRYTFDKTKHFIFYPEACNKYLKDRQAKELSDTAKIPHRSDENTERHGESTDGGVKKTNGENPTNPNPAEVLDDREKDQITSDITSENQSSITPVSSEQVIDDNPGNDDGFEGLKTISQKGDDTYFLSIEQYLDKKNIVHTLVGTNFMAAKKMCERAVPIELVLKTIDEVLVNAKGKKIRSFNYFEEAIWENFNRKKASQDASQLTKQLLEVRRIARNEVKNG